MKATSDTIRCFVALYPDADALDGISGVISRLREREPSVRWERPPQVHVTAKFIGDITRSGALRIARSIAGRLDGVSGIRSHIDTLGAFPNPRRPRIVWMGFAAPQPDLLAVQAAVEASCLDEGVEEEQRRFTPHFTIARVKQDAPRDLHDVLLSCSFTPIPVTFGSVRVMESTLTPSGAIHREIGRADLEHF